jgi:hypothetical protein
MRRLIIRSGCRRIHANWSGELGRWRRQRVGGALVLRGELERVPATILVGLTCGSLGELMRPVRDSNPHGKSSKAY